MKKIVFLILVLISNFAFSQSPSIPWAVPNNSASFTITMAKNSLCFQKDSAYLWRIDTIAASSRTLANTPKTLVGGGGSAASYWTQAVNYLYPTTITDSVGIGTTTPTTKLDVLGSSLFTGSFLNYNGKYHYINDSNYLNTTYGIYGWYYGDVPTFGRSISAQLSVSPTNDQSYRMVAEKIGGGGITTDTTYDFDLAITGVHMGATVGPSGITKIGIDQLGHYYQQVNGVELAHMDSAINFNATLTNNYKPFLTQNPDSSINLLNVYKIYGHTYIDSLLKINGTWYNRFDSLTISASADSSIFATKSYTLNNFKDRADSILSSGFLTRHQAALSYAPISVQNYFSKTGKNIYPTTANNQLMLGSATMSDTLGSTLLNVVNGSVIFKGTTGATPTSGAGTRLMWIPAKYAFRAGKVSGTKWDAANVGDGSFAVGDATASGVNSISFMDNATNAQNYSMACGYYATVGASNAFAFGNSVVVNGQYGFGCTGFTTVSTYHGFGCGPYNVIQGSNAVYSYDQLFFIGNGTGSGANTNSAVVIRRKAQMGINIGDTSAFPRSFLQINTKSNKYTDRNMFNFVDNVKNQKINTIAQSTDTSSFNAVFNANGNLIITVKDSAGRTTFGLDNQGEITHKLSHTFLSSEDTTYTPTITQNAYTKIIFGGKEFDNSTKTADSIRIDKAGTYYFLITISLSSQNGNDIKAALFIGGSKVKSVSQTTTGTANFQQIAIQWYADGLAAGTYVSLRMTNTTNNDDPSIKGGTIWFERKY